MLRLQYCLYERGYSLHLDDIGPLCRLWNIMQTIAKLLPLLRIFDKQRLTDWMDLERILFERHICCSGFDFPLTIYVTVRRCRNFKLWMYTRMNGGCMYVQYVCVYVRMYVRRMHVCMRVFSRGTHTHTLGNHKHTPLPCSQTRQ